MVVIPWLLLVAIVFYAAGAGATAVYFFCVASFQEWVGVPLYQLALLILVTVFYILIWPVALALSWMLSE